jgi:hypothetical protein
MSLEQRRLMGISTNKLAKDWRALAVLSTVTLLPGCGTTPVNELAPNIFSVTAQYGVLNGSWDRAQREAVAKARDYCAAKRETYVFLDEQRAGVLGASPQSSTITFSCRPGSAAMLQLAANYTATRGA